MADDARTAPSDLESGAHEVVPLWPDKADSGAGPEIRYSALAADGSQVEAVRNVSVPSLTVFRPDPAKANGVGVIICPGGGWRMLSWQHEGVDLAHWLTARGYGAFVLKYRLVTTPADPDAFAATMARLGSRSYERAPAAEVPRSLTELLGDGATAAMRALAAEDGRRALQIVRARAGEWGVAPGRIGMIGFSAGAFLTGDVAMNPGGPPLAFAAPIYGGETGGAPVPADAPPLFALIAQDDRMLFKVVEGLYADWSNADRTSELHVFARGGHGFGTVQQGLPVDRWVDLFGDWLADQGFA